MSDTLEMTTREYNLGSIGQIPWGEGREFEVAGRLIAVFRPRLPGPEGIYATQARCPHREGPLSDGLMGGTTIICPFHSWKFDLKTGLPLIGDCGLQTYPVRLTGEQEIVLTIPLSPTVG